MSYISRTHPRFQTPKLPASLRKQGTFVWLKGTVLNLSGGGMMLHCPTPLENGITIEIELSTTDKLGKKTLRKYKALIVWKKSQLYGVKFLDSKQGGMKT